MFARTYNLVLAGLWLGVAFCLLAPDNLVPEVVRGKLGGDQATLGGMLALVFAAFNIVRWWARRAGYLGTRPGPNPLGVRTTKRRDDRGDEEKPNPDFDFRKPPRDE